MCTQGAHILAEKHTVDRAACSLCFACAKICPTGALERCGREMSVEDVLTLVKKDQAFYGEMGGITLSGGEPLIQREAVLALLKACKAHGISTAVESCGYVDADVLRCAVPFVDLFMWDIKDTNPARHKQYTGVFPDTIIKNLLLINEMGAKIRLRCILVQGINTDAEHYRSVALLAGNLHNLEGVELIPYHAYGGTKAQFLGGVDNGNKAWIPEKHRLEQAKQILKDYGIRVL